MQSLMSEKPVQGRPWRAAGTVVASLGPPAVTGMLHPVLGEILGTVELAIFLAIILVALLGTKELSERAFRLLRWLGDRPEPPGPDHPASSS